MSNEQPRDPFFGDPADPARELAALDDPDEPAAPPLTPAEREAVLSDLCDLEVYRTLLEPRGLRGLVVDCDDCAETHWLAWDLLQANLRHLLDEGSERVHEPPYDPDPVTYVSWDYARGYADGVAAAAEQED